MSDSVLSDDGKTPEEPPPLRSFADVARHLSGEEGGSPTAEKDAEGGSRGEGGDDWWTTGSDYIGMRVARFAEERDGSTSIAKGTVVGWLPVEAADFVSETTGKPSALWHIKFDSDLVGEEDLEEFEVMDAIEMYKKKDSINTSKMTVSKEDDAAEWGAKKKTPKAKSGRSQETPSKPPNLFILWRSDHAEELKARMPPGAFFFRFAGETWKNEPQEVKDRYEAKHEELMRKYEEDLARLGISGRDSPGFGGRSSKKKKVDEDGKGRGGRGDSEGGKSTKKKKKKGEEFREWFCITVDKVYADEKAFRLWEICSAVKPDGRCRAREWYSFPDACPSGKSIPGEQRFKAIYTHAKALKLDPMAWRAVPVEKGVYKGTEYVQIEGETEAVDEAYNVLLGAKEPHAFPEQGNTPSVKMRKNVEKRSVARTKMALDLDDDGGSERSDGGESESGASQDGGSALQQSASRPGRVSSSGRSRTPITAPKEAPDGEEGARRVTTKVRVRAAPIAQDVPLKKWEDFDVRLDGNEGLQRRVDALKQAGEALQGVLEGEACAPIMLRLAWQDACSFAGGGGAWPACGGANGSVLLLPEADFRCNKGLSLAFSLLQPVHEASEHVSWADLIQMAGALAVQACGGPKIAMKYGRVDATEPAEPCAAEEAFGGLHRRSEEEGQQPFAPQEHLRWAFSRMGFEDKETVALMGGHTLGRARPSRSGLGLKSTAYTCDGPGRSKGGQSWTAEWLKFDNSYYAALKSRPDPLLLRTDVDTTLLEDAAFGEWVDKYSSDGGLFLEEYAAAHKKMSELGAKFDPPGGIDIGFFTFDHEDDGDKMDES